MCLVINKDYHPDCKPLIAKEDIFVRKWLWLINEFFVSPFRYEVGDRCEWFVNEPQPPVELIPKGTEEECFFNEEYIINEGYHAYVKPVFHWDGRLCLAKIPKGTKYFMGTGNDIVAEQMVLVEDKLYDNDNMYDSKELNEKTTNVLDN